MKKSVKEIAQFIGGEIVGDDSLVITGVAGIKEAKEGDITFLANPKYFPLAEKTAASVIIAGRDTGAVAKTLIRTDNPSLSFTKVIALFLPEEGSCYKGIHETAVIGKNVTLGTDVAVGPYVVIENNVRVGDKTIIHSGSFIGHHTSIGEGCLIYANVSIRERIAIGNRVIIHSGTVIGSDGFGFVLVKGMHQKIPQIGIVEIGDDVEIGANVTIDRARFGKTIIGKGSKIDNLVQIGHNVVIGENSLVIAQVGIGGSTIIGNNVTLAGQAGLVGHITVGDGVIVAAQAGVTKSIPPNTLVSGYPAKNHAVAKRVNACVQNLPKLYEMVNSLKKKIEELEGKLKEK